MTEAEFSKATTLNWNMKKLKKILEHLSANYCSDIAIMDLGQNLYELCHYPYNTHIKDRLISKIQELIDESESEFKSL